MVDNDKIWIGQNGQKYGPYSEANILQWLSEGKLTADAMAWRSGMSGWVSLASMFPAETTDEPPPPPPAAATVPPFNGPESVVDSRAASMSDLFSARRQDHFGAAHADRGTFPAPPSLHWGLVLLFTLLTLGVFGIIWPFIQANWVRKIDRQSNATLLVGLATACFVIGYIIYFAGLKPAANGDTGLLAFGGLLLLSNWVLYLVAYFSMAGSMRRNLSPLGLPVEIGGITLFFFTMYYLQGQLSWVARWKDTGQTSPKASKGVFWALWLIPFVIAIFAAISIPAYQDYLIRSEVSEGAVLADGAKTAMAEYYSNTGHWPPNNPSAGLAQSTSIAGKYVSSVDVSGGQISVAFDTPVSNSAIRNKVFVLTPTADPGSIAWSCSSGSVPNKYLPTSCRQ